MPQVVDIFYNLYFIVQHLCYVAVQRCQASCCYYWRQNLPRSRKISQILTLRSSNPISFHERQHHLHSALLYEHEPLINGRLAVEVEAVGEHVQWVALVVAKEDACGVSRLAVDYIPEQEEEYRGYDAAFPVLACNSKWLWEILASWLVTYRPWASWRFLLGQTLNSWRQTVEIIYFVNVSVNRDRRCFLISFIQIEHL